MSIWLNITQLSQTRTDIFEMITKNYGTLESGNIKFPFIVRNLLHDWIELRLANTVIPSDVSEDDDRFKAEASNFIWELFTEIERKRIELNSSDQQSDQQMAENLAITAKMFRLHYDKRDSENVNSSNHKNPISFYLYIRNCFETEKRLLGWSPESGENFIYDNHLARTTTRINRIITEIKVSIIEHETAALVNMQANTSQLLELESLTLIFDQLEKIMFEVIETHLAKWKEEQRLSANGLRKKSAINIGLIRIWSQEFVSIVCHVHEKAKLLQSLQPAGQNSIVDQYLLKFFKKINTTLVYLITSTVIFVYQPLQTFRNRSYYISRFVTQLEFLVGCKHVQMDAARPGNVILVSEDTALLTQQNNAVPENAACCEMENEVGVLVEKDDNRLLVDFSNIMIKKFKRAPRQGIWSAAEEKYAILFQSQFEFVSKKEEGLELKIQAWTMSLPIVPIVFGNQEKIADATILWDNAFAKNTRVPFEVRDSVSWLELIDAINMKFTSETYRSLTQLNIQFLAEKLNITSDDQLVSWLMFLRTNLPNRSFSFWEWFYAAFKLTSHHLYKIWVENYIIGFIKKDLAESYLMPWPEGTFLLRFSNSEIGGISIAWRTVDKFGKPCIRHFQPWTSKDFVSRSIEERLMDLEELTTLYPDRPKAATFCRFLPKPVPAKTGYIQALLKTVMPYTPDLLEL